MLKALETLSDVKDEFTDKSLGELGIAIQRYFKGLPGRIPERQYLRVSSLYFLCPRQFALNWFFPKPEKPFDHKSVMMMMTGTLFHKYVQDHVLGPMGILFGNWLHQDGTRVDGSFHPTMEDDNLWEYEELTLRDDQYKIIGHCDGMIETNRLAAFLEASRLMAWPEIKKRVQSIEPTKFSLLEVKTSGSFQFDKIKESKTIADYYKMQACVYQHLADVDQTVFLYVNRDNFSFFSFLYNHEELWVKQAYRKAALCWKSVQDRKLSDSMMQCLTPRDKRAKACPHAKPCFDSRFDISERVKVGACADDAATFELGETTYPAS
jgi:hypothetical protein